MQVIAPSDAWRFQDAGLAGAHRRQAAALVTSPVLGQHTGEVLQSWLGMNAGEVEALRGDGVVAQG